MNLNLSVIIGCCTIQFFSSLLNSTEAAVKINVLKYINKIINIVFNFNCLSISKIYIFISFNYSYCTIVYNLL
jgi:hypothetical protein